MSKTVRKLNDKLVVAIRKMNEFAGEELDGFKSLEHTVAFDLFPGSLLVTCYFEDQAALDNHKKDKKIIQKKLVSLLFKQGIVLKDVKQNLALAVFESK